MSRFDFDFQRIFGPDISSISDDIPDIQRELNAEHNVRSMGSARITDRIVTKHDDVMRQALTARQL